MKLIIPIIAVGLATTLFAKPITTTAGAKELCQKTATAFGEGRYKEAFDVVKPNWKLPEEEIDNLAYQTKMQLNQLTKRFGNPIGSEFIREEKAGNSIVRYIFIEKFEKHALPFNCTFYKAKDEWNINGITWSDNTSLLFK